MDSSLFSYICNETENLKQRRSRAVTKKQKKPKTSSRPQRQLANLVQAGYSKIGHGKYAGPAQRIWQSRGKLSGKFRSKNILMYVKNW